MRKLAVGAASSATIGSVAKLPKLSAEIHAACSGRASACWIDAELVTQMRAQAIARAELFGDAPRELIDRDRVERRSTSALRARARGCPSSSRCSSSMSARSASRCELTETYSPTAIDIAPATKPATPEIKIASFDAADAATPIIKLAVETIASSAPRTAARSQPAR